VLNGLRSTRANEIGLVSVVLTLSIHLHKCQGGSPPSTLAFVEVDGQSQHNESPGPTQTPLSRSRSTTNQELIWTSMVENSPGRSP
jgi:hypothetical protein